MNSKCPRFVCRGRQNATPHVVPQPRKLIGSVVVEPRRVGALARNYHGQPAQFGILRHLTRREERVHVDMSDAPIVCHTKNELVKGQLLSMGRLQVLPLFSVAGETHGQVALTGRHDGGQQSSSA